MATLEELQSGLVKADAAGNASDAKAFADAIRAMSPNVNSNSPPTEASGSDGQFGNLATLAPRVGAGVAENIASMATGATGDVAGGFAGIGQGVKNLISPGGMPAGDRVRQVQGAMTYRPRTEIGKNIAGGLDASVGQIPRGADWAGNFTAETTGSPAAGAAVNAGLQALPMLAGKAASIYGRGQMAAAKLLESQKAPLTDTMSEVRAAGYSIPPSTTNPTILNKILESIAGKSSTAQDASMRGNAITADLARKDLGVPASTGLTSDALDELSNVKAQPYRDVSALPQLPPHRFTSNINPSRNPYPLIGDSPPAAEQVLKDLRDARLDMKANWKKFSVAGGATERAAYDASAAKVAGLESDLEKSAIGAGRPDLIPKLQQARTDIAKIHDVDRALNTDRGEVSALDLAKARERGVPLSGGLETAAKMGNSYAKAIQDASKVGSPGVNNLNSMLGGGLGAGIGAATGIPGGASLGAFGGMFAIPATQSAMRALLLSKLYQNTLGTPSYKAGIVSRGAAKLPVTSNDVAILRSYLLSQQLQGQEP